MKEEKKEREINREKKKLELGKATAVVENGNRETALSCCLFFFPFPPFANLIQGTSRSLFVTVPAHF